MGLGDEADQARARLEAEDAAEDQRRRQNWAAIDSLVQEFILKAIERQTPTQGGIFKKYWRITHAQFENDTLSIWKNGDWALDRVDPQAPADEASRESLAFSLRGRKRDPKGPNPVKGLREGATQLLGVALETAVGLGDEADEAEAEHPVSDAAALEQRRQNWAALDSLVQEFIPEAIRRRTPKALVGGKRGWRVTHAKSERDELWIYENGEWFFQRTERTTRAMAFSYRGKTLGPQGPNPVGGFRDGAMRVLNR